VKPIIEQGRFGKQRILHLTGAGLWGIPFGDISLMAGGNNSLPFNTVKLGTELKATF